MNDRKYIQSMDERYDQLKKQFFNCKWIILVLLGILFSSLHTHMTKIEDQNMQIVSLQDQLKQKDQKIAKQDNKLNKLIYLSTKSYNAGYRDGSRNEIKIILSTIYAKKYVQADKVKQKSMEDLFEKTHSFVALDMQK